MKARLAFLAIAFILAGCSTQQKVIQSFDAELRDAHLRTLASIDSWQIRGRLSIRTDRGGQIGRIAWTRRGASHQIDVYGSLGSGHVRISEEPGETALADSEGVTLIGSSAQEVLEAYLGWRFPAEELKSWIVGAASPRMSSRREWDTHGHLRQIEQAGWQVTLSRYSEFDGYELPTRFQVAAREELQRQMARSRPDEERPSQIRLVINSWAVD